MDISVGDRFGFKCVFLVVSSIAIDIVLGFDFFIVMDIAIVELQFKTVIP